jgi:hypothetical protein
MFVRNVNQKWGAGERDPAQALDDMVALSIVAGLVKPADFTSIMAQAARSQKRPTLANGLEVERKRIRKLWPQLLKGYRPELPDRRRN